MGVPAEFQGRNDIVVDGKKISGNAQAWHKNKMLHHGTILFNADLAFVAKVLNVKQDKIESKGIKSNRARVTNIKPLLPSFLTIEELKVYLLQSLLNQKDISSLNYNLTKYDQAIIKRIQKDKYLQWSWNYGESPESQIVKEKRYPFGNLQLHFDVIEGFIRNLLIFGDYLETGDTRLISSALENVPYNINDCFDRLNNGLFKNVFIKIQIDDFLDCLFN
jgi:lipoate-protein ligase A